MKNSFSISLLWMPLIILLAGCDGADSDPVQLTSSPMLGHVGMRDAHIWAQTMEPVTGMYLKMWMDSSSTHQVIQGEPTGHFNCVKWNVHSLEPGSSYRGVLMQGAMACSDTIQWETQALWQYRSDPPAFTIATGSCTYINEQSYDRPGEPYGGDYHIFEAIVRDEPNAMVWLGDNVYLREVDLGSFEGYGHRYSHMRQVPELQDLLSLCPQYAIWDDHDFGPNDCDGSWVHQDWSRDAFQSFWANPGFGIPEAPELNVSTFLFGDVEFFMLDNRTHRVNHTMGPDRRQYLGEKQLNWLIQSLRNSRAPFKMVAVGGQMLSDAAIYENYAQYPEERERLLLALDELGIRGVVFLSGDRHNTELTSMQLPGGNWVYDLTVSPLTSGSYDHTDEPNNHRVVGTMLGERNYALLHFSGPRKERVLEMVVKNSEGEEEWRRSISAGSRYSLN
ncbi:MAG: alkaline phosphatase D family protein [Flavobacteriales bacterium]|nr:alkaline phosphatase D family protein [Flavobacteriales bacterium]